MSRLDFRNIENVIDEQEKVIARCFNRFGMLHLIVAEIAIPIVREQPCHDQKRIARRPTLMRHVGEEFGFVAACLPQSPLLRLERDRKSVVWGARSWVGVDAGGRRLSKKKK